MSSTAGDPASNARDARSWPGSFDAPGSAGVLLVETGPMALPHRPPVLARRDARRRRGEIPEAPAHVGAHAHPASSPNPPRSREDDPADGTGDRA
ncbi:hypothetical protein [Embleya sp. NPDC059259]|uniref:hypothetical protein n=1 Tax=unclassified Embleya TaxID=2699296 RepID=UPI0036B48E8C